MMGTSPSAAATLPRLSPAQKSYRDNPKGFLERLQARAVSLPLDGYTAYPADALHAFVVAPPPRPDEATDGPPTGYLVFPLQGACSCPFYARQQGGEYLGEDRVVIPCKHLLGLSALVRATCQRRAREGDIHACCHLWQHWMITQSKRRRDRVEREKRVAAADKDHTREYGSSSTAVSGLRVSGKKGSDE